MYKTILVTLDGTPTDRAIIEHIKPLARLMHSRVVLLHVATGVPAKYHGTDAAGKEVLESQAYLDRIRAEFTAAGIPAEADLAYGEPVKEIVNWVKHKGCEVVLVIMRAQTWSAIITGTCHQGCFVERDDLCLA